MASNHFITLNFTGPKSSKDGEPGQWFTEKEVVDNFLKLKTNDNNVFDIGFVKGKEGESVSINIEAVVSDGYLYLNTPNGTVNVGQVKGEQGDKGQSGDKGAAGDKGSAGIKGVVGDKGSVGNQGEQGDKGSQGDQGPTGDTGVDGSKGSVGATGDTGPKGLQGDQGLNGDQGPTGDTGPKGLQGLQGPQGESLENVKLIQDVLLNSSDEIIIEFTDGTTQNVGSVNAKSIKVGDVKASFDDGLKFNTDYIDLTEGDTIITQNDYSALHNVLTEDDVSEDITIPGFTFSVFDIVDHNLTLVSNVAIPDSIISVKLSFSSPGETLVIHINEYEEKVGIIVGGNIDTHPLSDGENVYFMPTGEIITIEYDSTQTQGVDESFEYDIGEGTIKKPKEDPYLFLKAR